MRSTSEIDWLACELIEQIPGKVSGRPIVKGTRIFPEAIVGSYRAGVPVNEIAEDFPALTVDEINRLIEFANVTSGQPVAPHRGR